MNEVNNAPQVRIGRDTKIDTGITVRAVLQLCNIRTTYILQPATEEAWIMHHK